MARLLHVDAVLTANAGSGTASGTARLEALFDTHYAALYRLARRLCTTQDDALDLVQDTFVRAARTLSRVPTGTAAEQAWLVRMLVNLQRDAWRRTKVRTTHAAHVRTTVAGADPEDPLVAAATVWQALGALPPRRRAVVVLHELDDVPVRLIASTLGISAVTVRWHLFRGREELAAALGAKRRLR